MEAKVFKPKCPCVQDCPDRTIYCKSTCEKYAEWDKQYKQYRAEIEAKAKEANEYWTYKMKVIKSSLKSIAKDKMSGRK